MLPQADRARAERIETKRSGRNLGEFILQVYLILEGIQGNASTCVSLGFALALPLSPKSWKSN
jgi:hypothetical protein